jgi:hypothetical protein
MLTKKDTDFKFPLHLNSGNGDYSMKRLLQIWDYIDFDIYLPTRGMNLQRPYVWTLLQKQELILSVFKDSYIPPLTVIQRDSVKTKERQFHPISLKIIDGKQRIMTLKSFIEGEFNVIWNNKEYNFEEIDTYLQNKVKWYPFRSNVYYEWEGEEGVIATDNDLIALFKKVNFSGTPQDKEHEIALENGNPQYKEHQVTLEHILCAAIWYKDLPLKKEEVLEYYRPKNVDKGIVFCGHRHANCLYQMVAMTGLRQAEAGEEVQGFLTNTNRFVDREEAATIALNSGQVKQLRFAKAKLFSEDLY